MINISREELLESKLYETTPAEYHADLFEAITAMGLHDPKTNPRGVILNKTLTYAIVWSKSPQGYDFWKRIHDLHGIMALY